MGGERRSLSHLVVRPHDTVKPATISCILPAKRSLQEGFLNTQRMIVTVPASSIAIGNNETVELEAVTYQGTLVIDSNNAWIYGAGAGRTVIDGDVTIEGNRNELRGVTVTGTIRIRGNINSIIQSDLDNATVIDTGNNNTY